MDTARGASRVARGGERRSQAVAEDALALSAATGDHDGGHEPKGRGSALGWTTPLVGRDAELAEVGRLLEDARLVTLTGAGGVGKTRLALEVTARWRGEGPEERVFVELGALESSDDQTERLDPVLSAISRSLTVSATGGAQPIGSPLDAVARHFGDRDALLVLDNCEHLAAAAAASEQLLRRCPGLRMLATSRRLLGLPGETVWPVPPLSVPAADATDPLAAVLHAEAGRLFVQRAQRSLPSFSLTPASAPAVAEICRRLDGLPLAIELAAARVRILTPHQILDGLADRFRLLTAGAASAPGRHRSLSASLDWSYELIDDHARAMLRLLGAAPDWSLEAIDATWTGGGSVLDPLAELVDAGLVLTVAEGDAMRYRLLETVRSYALVRLRAAGEERWVRQAQLRHFRALAADADRLLESDGGRRRLELEARSLGEALEFAVGQEPSLALAMVSDLRHWLLVAGESTDAPGLCGRVLTAAPHSDPIARAHVLYTAAQLAVFEEDYARAGEYVEQALPLANASGDDGAIGVGLMLASVAKRSTDPSASAQLGRQAVDLLTRSRDRHGLALAMAQLAMTEAFRDRFDAVRDACAQFASLTEGRPQSWLAVWLEIALAWADLGQGEPRAALVHCDIGLELEDGRPSHGHFLALSHKLDALTLIGDAQQALAIGRSALEQAQRAGVAVDEAIQPALGRAELALGQLESARARAQERFGGSHFASAGTAHQLLARIDLAEGRADPLNRHAAALRATGQHAGNDRLLALADWADGAAALLTGDLEQASHRLHDALAAQVEQRLVPDAIDTLEALAELQIAGGHAESGARLLGAAQRARAERELCRLPAREAHFARLHEDGARLLGPERWSAGLKEGQGLTLEQALDYARRGRGQRVRSQTGIAALTPTERRVADAAAEGLTTAAIAARLLMSRGTVKAHLAHIYRKLGIASRLQLAALLRARDPPA